MLLCFASIFNLYAFNVLGIIPKTLFIPKKINIPTITSNKFVFKNKNIKHKIIKLLNYFNVSSKI